MHNDNDKLVCILGQSVETGNHRRDCTPLPKQRKCYWHHLNVNTWKLIGTWCTAMSNRTNKKFLDPGAKFSKLLRKIFERLLFQKSMQIFKTSLEKVFERIWEDLRKKTLRKSAQFLKFLWKLLRKNLGKYVGKH